MKATKSGDIYGEGKKKVTTFIEKVSNNNFQRSLVRYFIAELAD